MAKVFIIADRRHREAGRCTAKMADMRELATVRAEDGTRAILLQDAATSRLAVQWYSTDSQNMGYNWLERI